MINLTIKTNYFDLKEPGTRNEETGTKNQEPGTRNQESRVMNIKKPGTRI